MNYSHIPWLLLIVAGLIYSCDEDPAIISDDSTISVSWGVETNFAEQGRFSSQMIIHNEGREPLQADWSLYFNFMRLIDPESLTASGLQVEHINGDFYKITPTDEFEQLAAGDDLSFGFEAFGSAIANIDAPDGAYLQMADGSVTRIEDIQVQPFERREQLHRSPNDETPVATPQALYEKNDDLNLLSQDELTSIIPTPVSTTHREGSFELHESLQIVHDSQLHQQAGFLSDKLEAFIGRQPRLTETAPEPDTPYIQLTTGNITVDDEAKHSGDEAYTLSVEQDHISVTGSDPAGVFYGIQSLRALLPPAGPDQTVSINAVDIEDAPGFGYRGLHLDVSRNFQPAEAVKRLLDVMAFYKLNKFHFHLTDDEGWRLAIDAFPELTEIGGRRGHTHDEAEHLLPSYGSGPDPDPDASMGSGWYSRSDYIEILQYANRRNIEVIPEIDVPGHARAALVAMINRYERLTEEDRTSEAEQYRIHDPDDESVYLSIQNWDDNVINACQESTYRFLEVVFDELIEMHQQAEAPLTSIHVGGDEVPSGAWEQSPVCNEFIAETDRVDSADDLMDYFFDEMESRLADRQLTMAAWEEFSLVENPETGETEPNPLFAGQSIPYVWSNIWSAGTESYSYELANAGYEIVMNHASNFYFDLSYQKHPEEAGLYWAGFVDASDPFSFIPYDLYKGAVETHMGHPIEENAYSGYPQLEQEARDNILGLQAQLWGETFRSPDRLEYMVLPRLLSHAERAWVPEQDWMLIEDRSARLEARTQAWNEFANRMGQHELPRLDRLNDGYGYRIPPPGAIIEDGRLKANVAYPGMTIRYTTDGSQPTPDSQIYREPVAVEGDVKLQTFTTTGRGSRVTEVHIGE